MRADDIPVAHTPPGGYGTTFPPLVLAGCDEPLVAGTGSPVTVSSPTPNG